MPDMSDMLKTKEAAEMARVSVETIYKWMRNGSLPRWRVGGHYRVRGADVRALAQPVPAPRPEFSRRLRKQWERFAAEVLERHGITRIGPAKVENTEG